MKVGVFGGTFDPVHWGHLVLAEEARLVAGLDLVLFVPSGVPPHKAARRLTPPAHRIAMVRLATDRLAGFEVSEIEAGRNGPHFTLETLKLLRAARPADELSFILGSDSLLELGSWFNPDEIVAGFPLVVLARPGFDPALAEARFTRRMTVVDSISVTVSSTLVRQRIAAGRPVRFLVPEPVIEYARRHALYTAAGAPAAEQ